MTHSAKLAAGTVAILALGFLAMTLLKSDRPPSTQNDRATQVGAETLQSGNDPGIASADKDASTDEETGPHTLSGPLPIAASSEKGLPALPPRDMSFSLQFDALFVRAQAGDPVASCRLILDSLRCANWERNRRMNETMTKHLSQETDSKIKDLVIEALASEGVSEDETRMCADFNAARLDDLDRLGPAAFAQLRPRQKLLLAMSTTSGQMVGLPESSIPKPGSMRITDDSLVPQYLAEHDRTFIADGIAAHDPLALEAAMLLYAPRVPANMRRLYRQAQPDALKFALYARLSKELFGEQGTSPFAIETLDLIEAKLSAEQRQELDQSVEAELPAWRAAQAIAAESQVDIDHRRPAKACE